MSILRNIMTAIRGGASEVGESIVDKNAVRILEQEMRDAVTAIETAKKSLSNLKSKEIGLSKKIAVLSDDIDDYKSKAKKALAKNDNALAKEVAERVIALTNEKDELVSQRDSLQANVTRIHAVIKKREQGLEKTKMEVQKYKAVEDLQKTQKAVAAAMPTNDSSSAKVKRALERVKKKQQDAENDMEADQWLLDMEEGDDLDDKIKKAGIGDNGQTADDLLAELQADDNSDTDSEE